MYDNKVEVDDISLHPLSLPETLGMLWPHVCCDDHSSAVAKRLPKGVGAICRLPPVQQSWRAGASGTASFMQAFMHQLLLCLHCPSHHWGKRVCQGA